MKTTQTTMLETTRRLKKAAANTAELVKAKPLRMHQKMRTAALDSVKT